jgi:predicted MPP superfamily phosphohydrolase
MKYTRREALKITGMGFLGSAFGGLSLAGYAFGYEPLVRLSIKRTTIVRPDWPHHMNLRIVALADVHACDPWMTETRIRYICERANALQPDIILLLGDYVSGMSRTSEALPASAWAGALKTLNAPLGVHAILGNHDWWEDDAAQARGQGPTVAGLALQEHGILVYENEALKMQKDGEAFWLAGLADQLALLPNKLGSYKSIRGLDELDATLQQVSDEAPIILMAHEPDIFPKVPSRVALTLCGHTHGGQIRIFGYSPRVPSKYGNRYAYGHIHEDGKDLVVSGGLGCSILPVRFGVPPEINLIDVQYGTVQA